MKLDKKLALEVFDVINELRDAHIKNNVKFESQYKKETSDGNYEATVKRKKYCQH